MVVRTLVLQYRGRPHLAYCIMNIPRYGWHAHLALLRHEQSALQGHALSRCNIDVRTSRTASRTFRATVAHTLALPYQGRPRHGNSNVRAIVARTSSQRL